MTAHAARVRMREKQVPPPRIVWRCPKRHTMLRVYKLQTAWHVLGESFPVPMDEWLKRAGSDLTGRDVREGNPAIIGKRNADGRFNDRKVGGVDQELGLDETAWPTATFEVGCRCGVVDVTLGAVADDVQEHKNTRKTVARRVSVY